MSVNVLDVLNKTKSSPLYLFSPQSFIRVPRLAADLKIISSRSERSSEPPQSAFRYFMNGTEYVPRFS